MKRFFLLLTIFVFSQLLISSTSTQQSGYSLTATLFFDGSGNTQFSNVSFLETTVDSQNRLIIRAAAGTTSCGFCNNLYSISPTGTLNWSRLAVGQSYFDPNLLVGPDDRVYFFQNVFGATIFSFDSSGNAVPGWPVALPNWFSSHAAVIDQSDGTVYARSGLTSSFEGFPITVEAINPDGTQKWRVDYADGNVGGVGIYQGPFGNLYTFVQGTGFHSLDRNDGGLVCNSTGNLTAEVGTAEGVYAGGAGGIFVVNGDCSTSTLYTMPSTWAATGLVAHQGRVFGYDYQIFPSDFTNSRFFAVSGSGTLLWRNEVILPNAIGPDNPIRAFRNGIVYVLGNDTTDGNKHKLFLLDENTGQILNCIETAPLSTNPGVAVAPDGTVYLYDRSSTKIYRIYSSMPPANSGNGWRMEGFNPSRTNRTPVIGPAALPSFQVIASNVSGRVRRIDNEGAVILSDANNVYSYSNTGQMNWGRSITGIKDVAIAADGTVYITTAGSVTALDKDTGQDVWSNPVEANTGNESNPLAIGANGTIYFPTSATFVGVTPKLTAINPNGTVKWEALTQSRGRAVFTTDESIAYLLNSKNTAVGPIGNVTSFSTAAGQLINNTPCDPRRDVDAFSGSTLYTGESSDNLFAFSTDIQTCSLIQTTKPTARILTISNNGVIVAQFSDATLGALGQTPWTTTAAFSYGFSDGQGMLYAVMLDTLTGETNKLVAIDIATGQERWRQGFVDSISGVLLGGDGNLYVTAGSNLIRTSIFDNCTITCPSNITVQNTLDQCGAVVNYPPSHASGNCETTLCSPPSGSFFPVGITAVTCASTGAGCSFSVTVQDIQPPTIMCPTNITAIAPAAQNCIIVNYTAPTTGDNCSPAPPVCNPPSGTCFPIGTTTVTCNATDLSTNSSSCSFAVTVVRCTGGVQSLVIEALDSPLDSNPNIGGGLRIFPDKQLPADSVNRKTVRIKATACPNTMVYFRSFDVDDPSTDDAAIDPNGSTGNDNRGTPQSGSLSIFSTETDNNGIATTQFTVTMHPGDNFKVAASTDQTYLNGVSAVSINLADSNGNRLPNDHAKVTPMLTVWRRFHIEVDSMGIVTLNHYEGVVLGTAYQPLAGWTIVTIDRELNKNRFKGGVIDIAGIGGYSVIDNNRNTVRVWGNISSVAARNKTFSIVDDDDYNNNNLGLLHGDEGEHIDPNEDTFSLMQDSDEPTKNIFAAAYMRPAYDGGGNISNNTDVRFKAHLVDPEQGDSDIDTPLNQQINLGMNSASNEADDFWVVYLQLGYQLYYLNAFDPEPNVIQEIFHQITTTIGVSNTRGDVTDIVSNSASVPRGAQASIVFMETMRDVDKFDGDRVFSKSTFPHEVGHQFGLRGDDNSTKYQIMSYGRPRRFAFAFSHLNILRWRVKSPGMP